MEITLIVRVEIHGAVIERHGTIKSKSPVIIQFGYYTPDLTPNDGDTVTLNIPLIITGQSNLM